MKLWQLNVKLRRLSDRLRWPLVTRKRFNTLAANYEAELSATNNGAEGYLSQLRASRDNERNLKQQVAELRRQLAEASKNDHRDGAGRFTKVGYCMICGNKIHEAGNCMTLGCSYNSGKA